MGALPAPLNQQHPINPHLPPIFPALPLPLLILFGHKTAMTQFTAPLSIKLRLKGGSGPNANWHWEIHDADAKVIKTGSAVGPEHKAFATARIAKEKLEETAG